MCPAVLVDTAIPVDEFGEIGSDDAPIKNVSLREACARHGLPVRRDEPTRHRPVMRRR